MNVYALLKCWIKTGLNVELNLAESIKKQKKIKLQFAFSVVQIKLFCISMSEIF